MKEVTGEVVRDNPPALIVKFPSQPVETNISEYRKYFDDLLDDINETYVTDEDFDQAKKDLDKIKALESNLNDANIRIRNDSAEVSKVFDTMAYMLSTTVSKRNRVKGNIKKQFEKIRDQIISAAAAALETHISALDKELRIVRLPGVYGHFNDAAKRKSKPETVQAAVDAELDKVKQIADQMAFEMRKNLSYLSENANDYRFLFNDLQDIINESEKAFKVIVDGRVDRYLAEQKRVKDQEEAQRKANEERRLNDERERIRKEEERKAQAEANRVIEEERRAQAEENRKTEEARRAEERSKRELAKNERKLEQIKTNNELQRKAQEEENKVSFEAGNSTFKVNPDTLVDETLAISDAIMFLEEFGIDIEVCSQVVEAIMAGKARHLTFNPK